MWSFADQSERRSHVALDPQHLPNYRMDRYPSTRLLSSEEPLAEIFGPAHALGGGGVGGVVVVVVAGAAVADLADLALALYQSSR